MNDTQANNTPNATEQAPPAEPASAATHVSTQTRRRTIYSLNVAIAIIAAVGVVVLVNWVVDRQYRQISPSVKDWIRFDLTATRQYSLSPQTKQTLGRLDQAVTVYTLFRDTRPELKRVRDLVDEYGRYSPELDVQHIDPDLDLTGLETFYEQLTKRFEGELKPMRNAIDQARQALDQVADQTVGLLVPTKELAEHPELNDPNLKALLDQMQQQFTQLGDAVANTNKQIEAAMDGPLPRFGSMKSVLESFLSQLDQNLLSVAIQQLERQVDQNRQPAAVLNDVVALVDLIKPVQQRVKASLEALQASPLAQEYSAVTSTLSGTPSVVVMSPDRVQVIPVNQMYRAPDPRAGEDAPQQARFLGEEKLTGTLVSLTLEVKPMVVFVNSGRTPAIGPQGEYEAVAERLRSAGFRVESWSPGGQMTSFGQPLPPGPPPVAEPGQPTAWIVLPIMGDPSNPMLSMSNPVKQRVATHIQERVDAGDAAMFMLSFNPASQLGGTDPLVEYLGAWGMTPQLDRQVLREMQLPDRRTQAMPWFTIDQWPDDTVITQALAGMPTLFVQSSPILYGGGQAEGEQAIAHYPLVQLHDSRMWTAKPTSAQAMQGAKYDEASAAETFTVAVAAQRGDTRIAVFADPAFAHDEVTTNADPGLRLPRMAEMMGAAYPGNSELFVNTTYWLLGLDELVAASPRTQDIRRIESMSQNTLIGYAVFIIGGLPALCLASGVGVWIVRRRG